MSNHDLPGTKSDSSSQEGGPAASADEAKAPLYMGGFRNLPVQRKLNVGSVDDPLEKEADVMASKVMRKATGSEQGPGALDQEDELRRKPFVPGGDAGGGGAGSGGAESGGLAVPAPLAQGIESARGSGKALPEDTRDFMGARFGADFSGVRIHTGEDAAKFSGALNAQAFTLGKDVFFNRGKFSPDTAEGQHLLAHELTHTMQQGAQQLRRKIDLKPPGKGEASAFDRVQELIDRLNKQSAAIQYTLEGNDLRYTIVDEASLSFFDRQMKKLIDEEQHVPLRLITKQGRISAGGRWVPVVGDNFLSGYVDLDDLMATDEQAFQDILIHFLTERFHVKPYKSVLNTDIEALDDAALRRFLLGGIAAHRAGLEAEAARLQDVLLDPSIRWMYDEPKADGQTVVRGFYSTKEKYHVFLVFHNVKRELTSADMFVQKADGKRLSIEEFRKERVAAAAAKAAPGTP